MGTLGRSRKSGRQRERPRAPRASTASALTWPQPQRHLRPIRRATQFMPLLVVPFPAFDPVLIHIGPFALRWYALAYITGILLGWLYARAIIRTERLWGGPGPMTVTDFDDFVLWATLGVILGGRIGYVLFYNPAHFAANPVEIVQLWKGGMSFHGGFIGVVLAVALFARARRIPFLSLADVSCA